jgi:hypothetical protein
LEERLEAHLAASRAELQRRLDAMASALDDIEDERRSP